MKELKLLNLPKKSMQSNNASTKRSSRNSSFKLSFALILLPQSPAFKAMSFSF